MEEKQTKYQTLQRLNNIRSNNFIDRLGKVFPILKKIVVYVFTGEGLVRSVSANLSGEDFYKKSRESYEGNKGKFSINIERSYEGVKKKTTKKKSKKKRK